MSGNPIYCALDLPDLDLTQALARRLAPHVGGIKLGLEFFCRNGPAGVAAISGCGMPLFLDLKLHDIPNTVAGAVAALAPLRPAYLTLHCAGGPAMLQAAVAARAAGTKLLGVSVLTSLDEEDLTRLGVARPLDAQVAALAQMARQSGLDGLVCSPREITIVRETCGEAFTIATPGIRPRNSADGDQKRTMDPRAALNAGADILVVGRPITQAPDPVLAAQCIGDGLIDAG